MANYIKANLPRVQHSYPRADPPDAVSITRMTEKILKHCSFVPQFKLEKVSLVNYGYVTYSHLDLCLLRNEKGIKVRKLVFDEYAGYKIVDMKEAGDDYLPDDRRNGIYYLGPAIMVQFKIGTGETATAYIAETRDVKAIYDTIRPDVFKDVVFAGEFTFLSSTWCERSGSHTNLQQVPASRHMQFWQWVMGPYLSKITSHGHKVPGISVTNLASTAITDPNRLAQINALVNKK